MHYVLYRDRRLKYRWRLIADNGKILAVSSESYERRIDCVRCIELVKGSASVVVKELK